MLQCHSICIYNRKKKSQNPPNPVLLNCTIEYLKNGNVNAIFMISRLTMFFLKRTRSKGWVFVKLENVGFQTPFGNEGNCIYLSKLKNYFQDYFHSALN